MANTEYMRYVHSGKLGAGVVAVPATGVAAALLLALVYAYVTVYSPIAGWISILFVLGYAIGVGGAMAFVAKVSKVRSDRFLLLCGGAVGLLALYTAWAAFESVLLAKGESDASELPGYLDLLLRPDAVWNLAGLINETGWYSIKSATPSGAALWAFWGIEALLVVGGVAFISPVGIAGDVFCESCDRWCEEREAGHLPLALPEDEAALGQVIAGDLEAIDGLDPYDGQAAHLRLELFACPDCQETVSLRVKLRTVTLDKDGKAQEDTQDLSPQYLIGGAGLARLKATAARLYTDDGLPRVRASAQAAQSAQDDPDEAEASGAADSGPEPEPG